MSEGDITRLLINAVPRSGTHLLAHVVSLLPGLRFSGVVLARAFVTPAASRCCVPTVQVGIDSPAAVTVADVTAMLGRITPGTYAQGHVPYSDGMAWLLREANVRQIVIIRDPRAVVASHARFLASLATHPLHGHYVGRPINEQLMQSIRGIEANGQILLGDIAARLRRIIGWLELPEVCVVRFEDLVGPRGGGTEAAQLDAIGRIARHAGVACDDDALRRIAAEAWGAGATFATGRIDAWRDVLTQRHLAEIDRLASAEVARLGY